MSRKKRKDIGYRPSASVIIAAKSSQAKDDYNYKLLLFKRTEATAYALDHCVFPGGVFEAHADESPEWLQHFQKFGITHTELQKLELHDSASVKRPHPLLTSGISFSRDISLRITAIRETFEEVGILLCHTRQTLAERNQQQQGYYLENFEREYWQNVVHNDATQFLRLCQTLDVVPDLWSLYEWSVWRTPSTSNRKYDTVLYFVALPEQPQLLLEQSEVQCELWHNPLDFLLLYTKRSIWLPPMQYYELSRLTHVKDYNRLLQFAYQRSTKGSTLLFPVYYRCPEGLIGMLPGDDFYPKDPNVYSETVQIGTSMQEFRQLAQHLHRIVICDVHAARVEHNIMPIDAHLSPLRIDIINSKL